MVTDLSAMTLLELIKEYGGQCEEAGMGYTFADPDPAFLEIEKRLREAGWTDAKAR